MAICPYHGYTTPCPTCGYGSARPAPATGPIYVPPPMRVVQHHTKDTCAVACCLMALNTQMCGRKPTWKQLLDYMKERGIYEEGKESGFGGLHYVFKKSGLRYDYQAHSSWEDIRRCTELGLPDSALARVIPC